MFWQPECSVLLDTLEQSICTPEIAKIFLKSLHRILQLSVAQTLSSLKSLDAIARVLKVACIQVQLFGKKNGLPHSEDLTGECPELNSIKLADPLETTNNGFKCVEFSMELFNEYLTLEENAKSLILQNSTCIDCLFDLFWEESIRTHVLEHVLSLLKVYTQFTFIFYVSIYVFAHNVW